MTPMRETPQALQPGPALNLAEHDLLPPKAPTMRYMVLSSPRTGSNALCRRLCNVVGRFGLPSEYLNPGHIGLIAPRALPDRQPHEPLDSRSYLAGVERLRTSDDGMFGIKAQPRQILSHVDKSPAAALEFVRGFDRLVLLTRRDKLAQAISGAIAQTTEVWFNDGSSPDLTAAQRQAMLPMIASNLTLYQREEQFIRDMGWLCGKPTLHVTYEEILADSDAVFRRVTDFLCPTKAGEVREEGSLPRPEKPDGALANELRGMFTAWAKQQQQAAAKAP